MATRRQSTSRSRTRSPSASRRSPSIIGGAAAAVSDAEGATRGRRSSTTSKAGKAKPKASARKSPAPAAAKMASKKAFDVAIERTSQPDKLVQTAHIAVALVLLAALLTPSGTVLAQWLQKLYTLAYPTSSYYATAPAKSLAWRMFGCGREDVYFVLFVLAVFTSIKELIRRHLLRPIGEWALIRNADMAAKFLEQGYTMLYWIGSTAWGVYLLWYSPQWYNTDQFWIGYPYVQIPAITKAFYLVQMAFWFHQLICLQQESTRSDWKEYALHHVVTCTLIVASYAVHITRIGCVILVLTDSGDIFLAGAKLLRYCRAPAWLTDGIFGFFVLVWIYTRHYLLGFVTYSILKAERFIAYKWDPASGHYWSKPLMIGFFLFVLALQLLMYFWLFLILKVIYKVLVRKEAADDVREEPVEEHDE